MEGRPLQPSEIWNELIPRNTGRSYQHSNRNKLLLILCCYTSLRPIELSLLQIRDLISPEGYLSELIELSEAKAYDGQKRPVLFTHPELQKEVERYLAWVIEHGICSHPGKQFLGLNPNAYLLLNDDEKPFGVQKRGSKDDGRQKLIPVSMNTRLDQLIKDAGLWDRGIRRSSFLKTYVIESYRNDMSSQELSLLAGVSVETISKYLTMDTGQISEIIGWWKDKAKRKQQRINRFKKMRRFMI